MGSKILGVTSVVVSIVIGLAAVLQTAEAETHSVSWSNTVGADFYTSWATNHTFKVGDILVFNFTTGRHDVAEVKKDAYEKCNVTDIISKPKYDGPANYTLNATGDYYFICLFPGHCDQGQKLTIAVTTGHSSSAPAPAPNSTSTPSGSKSPPPPPPPPPSTTSTPPSTSNTTAPPPPKGSAGSPSHVVTISTVFVSIAVAVFCLF